MDDICKNGHVGMRTIDSKGSKDCRECIRIRNKKYRETNHERVLNSQRQWYRRNTDKVKAISAAKHDRKHFSGLREAVIERDGAACVKCGITRVAHIERWNRDIEVNHIDGNGTTKPLDEHNNSIDNLETLCRVCHTSKDRRRVLAAKEQIYG